jgi:ATP-binding cassette subfamily F protein 3
VIGQCDLARPDDGDSKLGHVCNVQTPVLTIITGWVLFVGVPVAGLENIEKTFGPRVLFEGLNFQIDRGERVGLIGENGSGKTTLFKIITAQVMPDSGSVSVARSVKLGYLEQDASFDSANTVMDEAELAFAELHELSHRLRDIEHAMAGQSGEQLEKTLRQYQMVQHEFDLAGGYAWRHRLEATLQGVGLEPGCWGQNVETLSGGQRSRLALAKLLISEPDLLLLDEPTNHLDLSAIEWLEKYLLDFKGAVLLISHDRFLLDRLATRIVWLTRRQLSSYPGNYSSFVQQRDVQELSQQRAYELQQEDIAKQQEFIRRFGAGQRSKEARGREKRLNRLLKSDAMIEQVQATKQIHVKLHTDQRAGDRVLRVHELSKSFPGKQLWDNVKFEITRGERIGIIGPNGSGKTTLLRVLMGQADADVGDIKWGANLNIGYYDQRLDDFDPELTILQEVGRDRMHYKDRELRDVLATLLFRGDDVHKPMGLLSGGERARVALAELLLDRPNVLLLDEPTNHLDITSCEALEGALRGFEGTIVCVSHDRYFLDKIVSRLLVIDPPTLVDFAGGYRKWMQRLSSAPASSPPVALKKPPRAKPQAAKEVRDNPYKRPFGRLTVQELEKQIHESEQAIKDCQSQFGDPESFRDPLRARRLQEEYESLQQKLEQLEAEYFLRES